MGHGSASPQAPSSARSSALLIGSCEPFSGKSAVVLGLARQWLQRGVPVRIGKPLADSAELSAEGSGPLIDDDVRFVGQILGLGAEQLVPSVHLQSPASARERLLAGHLEAGAGLAQLQADLQAAGDQLTILEGAGGLSDGVLYGLSLVQVAQALQAPVVLVHSWSGCQSVEPLLQAHAQLGSLLSGVVLNGLPPEQVDAVRADLVPALERLGLPVLGVMPRSPLLRSVTVEELVRRLEAQVLCCRDRLDLLVETLSIGAMNVNSAMEFFRRRRNMAVVTGADRTDIQLAALEASTQCLILTGAGEPLPQLVSRAEELEVPLLKVEHDTLTTVGVIENAFGHVRLHESVKATYAFRLVEEHCDFEPLLTRLRLPLPA